MKSFLPFLACLSFLAPGIPAGTTDVYISDPIHDPAFGDYALVVGLQLRGHSCALVYSTDIQGEEGELCGWSCNPNPDQWIVGTLPIRIAGRAFVRSLNTPCAPAPPSSLRAATPEPLTATQRALRIEFRGRLYRLGALPPSAAPVPGVRRFLLVPLLSPET